jgi:hypothetical protein
MNIYTLFITYFFLIKVKYDSASKMMVDWIDKEIDKKGIV